MVSLNVRTFSDPALAGRKTAVKYVSSMPANEKFPSEVTVPFLADLASWVTSSSRSSRNRWCAALLD